MPSLAHHALVDLFREQPSLAPQLLARAHGLKLPRGARCQLGDTNLDQLRPAERRADLVLELRRGRRTLLVLILEVQRRIDRHKFQAWLEYLVSARRRGPACVVVITTSARVAAWAARPFDLGPGNESLRIWVIGPQQIEAITDRAVARESPGLAFLSALVHARRNPDTLKAAVASLFTLSEPRAELYYNLLTEHLPPALRPDLEFEMLNIADDNLPPSPLFKILRRLAKNLSDRDKEKAPTEALAVRRTTLLRLMHRAGFTVTVAQQLRVERCVDAKQLDRWTDRVLTAESAREVFAAPKKRAARKPAAKKQSAASKRTQRS